MQQVYSGNFTFVSTPLEGVQVVESRIFDDGCSTSMEAYRRHDFEAAGIDDDFAFEHVDFTHQGTVRGLYYSKRRPTSCLVSVLAGEVFACACDLRPDSPTFKEWHGETLDAQGARQLYIPRGCAYGVLTLSEDAVCCFRSSEAQRLQDREGILYNDLVLRVRWPLPNKRITASEHDLAFLRFRQLF